MDTDFLRAEAQKIQTKLEQKQTPINREQAEGTKNSGGHCFVNSQYGEATKRFLPSLACRNQSPTNSKRKQRWGTAGFTALVTVKVSRPFGIRVKDFRFFVWFVSFAVQFDG